MTTDLFATPMPSLTMRRAVEDDLAWIMEWEKDSFAHPWSESAWAEEIRGQYVAVAWGGVVSPATAQADSDVIALGVIAMSAVAGTSDLRRIIVAPGARRRGVGAALVHHGLGWAWSQEVDEVFLEVSASHDVAIHLYESCGFALVSVRADYYGPGDDAMVYRATSEDEESRGDRMWGDLCLNR